MYYYFFLLKFLRSTFNLEKKSICYVKYLFHPVQATGSIYCGIVFQCIYIYLKDKYITLKGIGKILFVSVLKILLSVNF